MQCTGRGSQAFGGAYEEQRRVTKTALCVKCLPSKHKDLICDPQNPRGSWAWLGPPATPACPGVVGRVRQLPGVTGRQSRQNRDLQVQ